MSRPIYIDVRENDEFKRSHIPGAVNLPMSSFDMHKDAVVSLAESAKIILFCQSGVRAQQALAEVVSADNRLSNNLRVWEGGMNNWQGDVKSAESGASMPLMRQVLLVAGSLILVFGLLGMFINAVFYYAVLFVGGGLAFAGLSGICPMAMFLAKMPWNNSSCCSKGN